MLHAIWHNGSEIVRDVPLDDWPKILESQEGLLWVDLDNPSGDELDLLSDIFKFHPLAIEDCVLPHQRPKIDDYDSYLFVIFHALSFHSPQSTEKDLDVLELNLFVGPNYVVSMHEDSITQVGRVRSKCIVQPAMMTKGSGFLLHAILDQIVDDMMQFLVILEDKLDEIENMIMLADEDSINELYTFKELISKFRKVAGPQRDVVRLLTSEKFAFIDAHQTIYFKDVFDHILNVTETVNHIREVVSKANEQYLSMVSRKMNDVMKVLTVVLTIFLPLQLIAAIYGMNFKNMPELDWQYGYFGILFVMSLVAIGMAALFRRLKWF
ncbi:MAG: magnesium/cobalt transporter CorA [Candidatus Lindowbacteria bacterium]|nr:magnesium/cobalt transporter CorA [Candidatus Lindowbacteria bacterium]